VRNPLDFETHYFNQTGSGVPYFTGVTVDGLRVVNSPSGAKSTFQGFSASYPLGLTLENVSMDDTAIATAQYARIGEYDSNITPSGTGVSVTKVSGSGSVPSCGFPAYPGL
jgi:polygalacturonase